jgi:hypothetical protein
MNEGREWVIAYLCTLAMHDFHIGPLLFLGRNWGTFCSVLGVRLRKPISCPHVMWRFARESQVSYMGCK